MVVVILILSICGIAAYSLWASYASDSGAEETPPTEAELLQARLDLHRVERNVDVAFAKHEQRREVERVKRAIAEALEDDAP